MRRESTLAAFKSMAGGMSERLMSMATMVRRPHARLAFASILCSSRYLWTFTTRLC